jgi:hypothetical protein
MSAAAAIELTPVTSSRIAAIGHCPETFTLAVKFPPAKKSPAGKVYHYANVSEEMFDDMKNASSVGVFFGQNILNSPDAFPFTCVDEGVGDAPTTPAPAEASVAQPKAEVVVPEDTEELKTFAMATRNEVTALSISTGVECEAASLELLRIRAERKLAIERVNKIKTPATAAWKAACDLFNEIDGRYAEAEKYLDGAILAYRAAERRRADAEAAEIRRQQEEAQRAAVRAQQEEHRRLQAEADAEAEAKAAELAEQDAQIAEAQGASEEAIEAIRENPLPVQVRHVAPPPLAVMAAPAQVVVQQDIPKVAGLGFTTAWCHEITDESLIPFTHEFYTLDTKKVAARVNALKQHANIPGVRVWSEERSIKRTGTR